MSSALLQILNALSFAAILFIVASGFTLIFGLLRVVNLGHGALYLLGGYIGMSISTYTGSFLLGIVGALLAIAVVGFAIDRWLLERVKDTELKQVLLTLGVATRLWLSGAATRERSRCLNSCKVQHNSPRHSTTRNTGYWFWPSD
ncbi:hypothetical protein JZU54_08850 [bacterium]|nr:hypothetical protein [bacterium]